MRAIFLTVLLLVFLSAGAMPASGAGPAAVGEETAVGRTLKYKACEKDLARAVKLLKKRQAADAEASLRQCLKIVPEHYEAHYLLAQVAAERGDYAAAVGHLQQAEAEMERMAGLCRAWQAESEREETAERELVSGEAQDTMIKSPCAANSTKIDTGRLDRERGITSGSRLAPLDPRRFEVPAAWHFAHGNFLYKSRRWADAAARYRLALERDPRLGAAWNNLLGALMLAGQVEAARSELQQALQAGADVNPELRRAVEAGAVR
ncbi:MAG: tetratricopeptide repeat protein [Acidobacteria bacterium]|jgi:Tfp pilus assembly protein PilF|nr:tetratricopeptide repeat protein [Acidobacteriota bacterium]